MVLISIQSFVTMESLFSDISEDGHFESFTSDRFQTARGPIRWAGLCLGVFSGFMFFRWERSREYFHRLFTAIKEFAILFRQDAWFFFHSVRDGWARQSRVELLALGGLMLAAIVLRFSQLNAPLLADEAYTYNAFASGSLWQTVSDYHLPNNHVLLSIMINILTHLFGNHVWLIRLPTMVAGVLMVPAGYVLARKLYGRSAAFLSAALITVFPILIMYSVWARGYGIISLVTLLILIIGDDVGKNKNRFAWFLLIILSTAGFYTVPIMLFPFGALYLWLFLSWAVGDLGAYRSRLDFIGYWLTTGFASALLTVFLYVPILITDYDRFFHNQFIAPVGWNELPASLADGLRMMWLDWTSAIPGWIIMIGTAGLIASLVLHKKISRQRIPLPIAFLVWIVALIVIRRPDMNARSWLFLAAPLLIWSAGGIAGLLELISASFRRKVHLAEIVAGVVVISVFVSGVLAIPGIPARWSRKSGIETAVLYLKDNLREGDIVNASSNSLSIIRYYFNVYDIPLDYVRRSGKFQRAFLAVSRESDSPETLAPVDGAKRPLINLATARIILQLDGLTIYECYPAP